MAIVEKKIWSEYFKEMKAGKKRVQIRLADFDLKKGDTLVLKEWNPKKKIFTGKSVKFKINKIFKIPEDLIKFYPLKYIRKYGVYVIEMER